MPMMLMTSPESCSPQERSVPVAYLETWHSTRCHVVPISLNTGRVRSDGGKPRPQRAQRCCPSVSLTVGSGRNPGESSSGTTLASLTGQLSEALDTQKRASTIGLHIIRRAGDLFG